MPSTNCWAASAINTPSVTIASSHATAFHPCGGASFVSLNIAPPTPVPAEPSGFKNEVEVSQLQRPRRDDPGQLKENDDGSEEAVHAQGHAAVCRLNASVCLWVETGPFQQLKGYEYFCG